MIGITDLPSFQTLYRGQDHFIDLHAVVNRENTFLLAMESIVAIDSILIRACRHSPAMPGNTGKLQ